MKALWWRILLAAFALEIVYAVLIYSIFGSPDVAFQPLGMAIVFVLMLLGGLWIGRQAGSRPVWKGALVGVAAALLYTVLTIPVMMSGELPVTAALLLNHAAKILGAAAGGALAATVLAPKARAARLHGSA